jgi:hypothetical protein
LRGTSEPIGPGPCRISYTYFAEFPFHDVRE